MHIDWFVFFAQIVNFLILVYLLKRFLYGRIVKAMDNREARIVARFEEAERLRKEAEASAAQLEEKNRAMAERQEDLLNQMVQAAEARRKELLEKARQDVDLVRQRWQETIQREKDSFLQDLRQRTGRQIYAITRQVLTSLADTDLESQIVRTFLRRLEDMDGIQKQALQDSIASAEHGIVIQSAFPIQEELRRLISERLKDIGGNGTAVRYETTSDVLSGVELRAHGHKLAWSVGDYLESLEEGFAQALMEEARARA